MPVLNVDRLIDERVSAILDFHKVTRTPMAEIDVSGGVDSAVLVGLLSRALGPENVIAVHSGINTDPKATERAREVCGKFGVRLVELDLTEFYSDLVDSIRKQSAKSGFDVYDLDERCSNDRTILGSIRSTLRAPVGRACNRMLGGGIRHGTGNEDEDRFLRFYQKGGDGEVDTNPIAMLSKGETYQLAIGLGVPHSVLLARPSPDLWGVGEEHNDESEIGAYLGFQPQGQTFYSYVDPETGTYRNVGLIERTARFLDLWVSGSCPVARYLFDDGVYDMIVNDMTTFARTRSEFLGVAPDDVKAMLAGARRVERITRHKANPNIPMLGNRYALVRDGILSNELPTSA